MALTVSVRPPARGGAVLEWSVNGYDNSTTNRSWKCRSRTLTDRSVLARYLAIGACLSLVPLRVKAMSVASADGLLRELGGPSSVIGTVAVVPSGSLVLIPESATLLGAWLSST